MMMLKIGDVVGIVEMNEQPSVPVAPDRWCAITVHPQRERRVRDRLLDRGLCCYAPFFPRRVTIVRRQAWQRPIQQTRTAPLFPGLVFVPDFDARDMLLLRSLADGVVNYLRLGERPATLSSAMIDDIRAIEQSLNVPLRAAKARYHRFKAGDLVRVRDGSPFAMWVGRVDRLDCKGRLRVLISAIEREVAVELSSHQVEPVQ